MSALLRVGAALLLGIAATLTLAGPSAGAARASGALCSAHGVDVIVDYGALGGGVARGCATGGAGQTGDQDLKAAGYPVQYVPNQPGFACAVGGKPTQCKMPGAGDPWWGLFWSDGKSGTWKTAMVAVDKLTVPEGGSIAMVWETGKKVAKPSVAAPRAADRHAQRAQASASPSATPLATSAKGTGGSGGSDGGGGLSVWVPVGVVVVLLGGGAAVALRRRSVASQ